MIYGLDVSSHQENEFPLTTPGGKPVDFVIIKVTQGLGYTNPRHLAQLDWARKHDLSVGFYHFADAGSIDKQADFFLGAIRSTLRLGDHLWFDWEKQEIENDQKDAWIQKIQMAEPEHRVGLYCNRDYWLTRDRTSFAGDALWIADWNGMGNPPRIAARWKIHQFQTDRGVDENVADFESRAAMKAWAGLAEPAGADVTDRLVRIEESLAQLGRQVADIPTLETTQALADLAKRVAKLQTDLTALPRRVADEINKRLQS